MFVIILMLSMLLSADAMAVGISYGIKKVSLPATSKIIIGLCSVLCGFLSMGAGNLLAKILPNHIGKYVGSIILFAIGIWFLLQNLGSSQCFNKKTTLLKLVIKGIGITIIIVRDPSLGDIDNSGSIDHKESLLIGSALSMDVIGAGLGLGVAKVSSFIMPLMAGVFQFLFLYAGLFIGSKIGNISDRYKTITGIMPGVIMIMIAVLKLIF